MTLDSRYVVNREFTANFFVSVDCDFMDSQLIIEMGRNAKWFVYAVGVLSLVVFGQVLTAFIPLITKRFFNSNNDRVVKECSRTVETNLVQISQSLLRLTQHAEAEAERYVRFWEVTEQQKTILGSLAQGHRDFQRLWQDFIVDRQKLCYQVDEVHKKLFKGA